MQRQIQGLVVVQAKVGKDGRVKEVKVINGNSLLTAAAAKAVREWRYEPLKLNGEPVEMTTQVTLKFVLEPFPVRTSDLGYECQFFCPLRRFHHGLEESDMQLALSQLENAI